MKIGVTFPQSDLELNAADTRIWAEAVEDLGFDHILFYDHVLGADRSTRPGWSGFHDMDDRFHEVMVLMGYLAAVTSRVELVTGVVALPQRQTALVAKQAAEVDHLSGGRLRLGVGIGANDVEYQALGKVFENRGRRIEEQIELLRQLWTMPVVDFDGQWEQVVSAGINPLPIQQPIPLWIGSSHDRTIERVARLADGWLPETRVLTEARRQIPLLHSHLADHGRDHASFGLQGRLSLKDGDKDYWGEALSTWSELGATHFSVSTIWFGVETLSEHIGLLEDVVEEFGAAMAGTP